MTTNGAVFNGRLTLAVVYARSSTRIFPRLRTPVPHRVVCSCYRSIEPCCAGVVQPPTLPITFTLHSQYMHSTFTLPSNHMHSTFTLPSDHMHSTFNYIHITFTIHSHHIPITFTLPVYASKYCFILSSSCGYYAVSSVSVSAATRLAYDTWLDMYYMYADLTFLFLSEVYDLFQLLCIIFCFYLFSS